MECYRQTYKKCVVPGCEDLFNKKHSFPKNDIALFDKWIVEVNNPILNNKSREQIYKSYRVCDLHFSEDYRVPGTKRGLKKTAFPTLLLSGISQGDTSSSVHPFQLLTKEEQQPKQYSVDFATSLHTTPLATSLATKLQSILSSSIVSTSISERRKTPENRTLDHSDTSNLSKSNKRYFPYERAMPSCSTMIPETESTPKKAKLDRPTSELLVKQASYTLSTPRRKPLEASSIPGSTNTGSLKGIGSEGVDQKATACGNVFLEKPIPTGSCEKECQSQKDSTQSSCQTAVFYSKRVEGKLINFAEDFQNETGLNTEWARNRTTEDISDENSISSDNDSILASSINNGSDFALRKQMFKQFVIKVIDEITNEKDLNALEQMFAQVVPLPNHMQGNVKMY